MKQLNAPASFLVAMILSSATGIAVAQVEAKGCDFAEGKRILWGESSVEARQQGLVSIRCAATFGNPEAQTYLATLLAAGVGVQKNAEEAVQWLRKAADKKFPAAMTRLAFAHLHGEGAPLDKVRARELLHGAAELGDEQAMANLGAMYGMGDGVPQSNEVSASWYLRAAKLGGVSGQVGIANMYLRGHGVEQSFKNCYLWAALAERQDFPRATPLASKCAESLSVTERQDVAAQVAQWKPEKR